jgi:hypothetical protein
MTKQYTDGQRLDFLECELRYNSVWFCRDDNDKPRYSLNGKFYDSLREALDSAMSELKWGEGYEE